MMIRIIAVGKIKEKYFIDALKEYEKRLSKYTKFELIEVKDESIKENPNEADIKLIKKNEGANILKHIASNSFIITLEIDGIMLSSLELAEKIQKIQTYQNSHITFIIGGSVGLDEDILKLAQFHLSFSKMTFTHQMMRVILLEQIYRAFKINNNESYHK